MEAAIIVFAIIFVMALILTKTKITVAQLRNWLMPTVVVGMFTLYYIGYSQAPLIQNEGIMVTMLRAAQFTARIFVLMVDFKGIETAMQNPVFYGAFVTVNVLAVILFVLSAMTLFARRTYGWLRLFAKYRAESYIFTNANEESLILARDIRHDKPHAVVIFLSRPSATKGDKSLFKVIEEMGGIYIESMKKNPMEITLLRMHAIQANSHIFFISDEEERNIAAAIALVNSVSEADIEAAEKNVKLYVRFYSNDIRQAFEERMKATSRNIPYTIFSDAELIAYDVVETYPPVDQIKIDTHTGAALENYEVMIIGFDRKGRAILRKMIEMGQFVGSQFKATIVDQNAEQKQGSFATLYPALEKNYDLNFVQTYVGGHKFLELMNSEVKTLKQIVIALGNDSLNIQTAIEIHKLLLEFGREEVQILTVVASDENYTYIHSSQELSAINCIGQQTNIFTEENVVKGAISRQAERINEYYRRGNPAKPEWLELEYIKKESNISVAMHIPTKLKLLGLTTNGISAFSSEEKFTAWLNSNPVRFDNLARTEHLRWNATYFTRGWKKLELSPISASAHKDGQDHHRHLHCCLVDWEELPAVDEFMGQKVGTYHEHDHNNIINLYTLSKL